ncbi:MAG: hypothetical protein QMD65_01960 [Patescibacteria group bacterium]|nr:hypothetical protein [Patescibacteria group bacterium]
MSVTQIGNYVALTSFILGLFKINIATEELSQAFTAVFVLVGLAISWYGRFRKGDLTPIGRRK